MIIIYIMIYFKCSLLICIFQFPELIKKSSPSRIINVSSLFHSFVKNLDPDDLNFEKSIYKNAYAQSKICNIFFTLALAEKLKGTGNYDFLSYWFIFIYLQITVNYIVRTSSGYGLLAPVCYGWIQYSLLWWLWGWIILLLLLKGAYSTPKKFFLWMFASINGHIYVHMQ